jgi:ribosomal protein S27AE
MSQTSKAYAADVKLCWNCQAVMDETGDFYTCPKCGATDTDLPSELGRVPGPTAGQLETASFTKSTTPRSRRRRS